MEQRLQILAQHIIDGLNLEEVTVVDLEPDTPLFGEGLGLDSIDALELVLVVERHYGIKIEDMEQGRKAFTDLQSLDAFIQGSQAQST
jgi:acyl carrier protein